ncbi:hypothetical protein L1987_75141 [Smallanthus sonchifolius]|uniref:Uncharacterized protein n=1 Tax=Smallanthus sonchifolius TaxID=185202 RepID=A0ACB9A451_9ASTR|nr:hypothetical protein L1987_75141 [Smallanthus sonchifolius]
MNRESTPIDSKKKVGEAERETKRKRGGTKQNPIMQVREAERETKRKKAIATWDWENFVDLTKSEDEALAHGEANDFDVNDNDDFDDTHSDDTSGSALCINHNINPSGVTNLACRRVNLD